METHVQQYKYRCGSASKWPAGIGLTDRAANYVSPSPGSLIAAYEVHASSPAHAQSGALTGRRPPTAWPLHQPGASPLRRDRHCAAEAAMQEPMRPLEPAVCRYRPQLLRARSAWPSPPSPPRQVPRAATSLAHSRLCQSVLLVHRMLAQETTGTLCNA